MRCTYALLSAGTAESNVHIIRNIIAHTCAFDPQRKEWTHVISNRMQCAVKNRSAVDDHKSLQLVRISIVLLPLSISSRRFISSFHFIISFHDFTSGHGLRARRVCPRGRSAVNGRGHRTATGADTGRRRGADALGPHRRAARGFRGRGL